MSLQEARKQGARLALAQRGSSAGFGGRIKEFGFQLKSKGFAAEQVCWLAAGGKLPAPGGERAGQGSGSQASLDVQGEWVCH